MKDGAEQVLQEDYYLTNFHVLAGFVVETYADLLLDDENDWYGAVKSLTTPAQRLYIRLLSRRGSTFRISRLRYSEIEHIGNSAVELADKGLASLSAPDDVPGLLACFTKPELIERLGLSRQRGLNRAELLAYIEACAPELSERYTQQLQLSEQWVTISGHAYWTLIQLCFFGNLYQDSSEFVLRQLGTLTYENYIITPSARAFTSREQIEAHWRYFECASIYEYVNTRSVEELLTLSGMLPDSDNTDLILRRRVDRLRNRIARQLERLSHADQAVSLYKASVHPPARERQVRIMMARRQWHAAVTLSEDMQRKPYNESELITAQHLLMQCRKSQGLSYVKGQVFKPHSSKLVLRDSGKRVEEQARAFFAVKGECFYTENTLINAVLGLFIWDIIFHPIPGVFYNPFQSAPADFKHPQFIHRRRELLDDRFLELSDTLVFTDRVLQAYERHRGKVNPLVNWHLLPAQLLNIAIERIPSSHWRILFTRILSDLRENTSGFPDLVLFPDSEGYEFIEIKGPGDTLQANQRRWMAYFDEHQIACRVVHIRYRSQSSCNSNIDAANR